MADISKIKPNGANGTEYDIKDATARSAIADKANNTQTFTEASTRANIASGENMQTLFGKIKKFFSDLKTVAFTGSYSDLVDQPTIPAAANNNTITIQLNGTTIESFTLNQSTNETINIQVTKSSVGLGNVPNVATNDQTPTFTQASTRANIASGEKLSVIFGKIMKWFADLKTVAFSGSYTDLSNTPSALPASDVYAWAKAATKPTYTASEVGALAVNGTAAKATADADGNTISTTYMKKGVDYVTAGKKSGTTLGSRATAEGTEVTVSGDDSHGEGYAVIVLGEVSHGEGYGARVDSGVEAGHAEGKGTVVSHSYSHAQGFNTKTGTAYQNVQGKFNVGKSNTLLEVGMGTSNTARSNAFEVAEVGDVYAGRSNGLTNDLKLPTGADVISYLNSKIGYYTVINAYVTTTTKTSVATYNSRKFSDYNYLMFLVYDNAGYRASMFMVRTAFTSSASYVSLTWVDSSNSQYWVEVTYKDDTHCYIQAKSNAAGKSVNITGLL